MGPGKDFEKGMGIMNPPMFEPDQDLLTWRKKVASWVDLIATAAEKGQDRLYKTVFHTLGRQLYDRGLRQAQQSLVDEAQEQGKIDYKQDDQVKAVQEIVELIAKDPPISVVTRLIDSFNKVTLCKRKHTEDLNRFISRFRGLAAEHLMRAGSSSASQIGEVLAITLLNNASLSESSLTNAKLRLIGMAEERTKLGTPSASKVSLTQKEGEDIMVAFDFLGRSIVGLKRQPKSDFKLTFSNARKSYNMVSATLKPIAKGKNPSTDVQDIAKAIASSGPRCVLSLDDAVTVLRSLAQTTVKSDQAVTKTQMENAFDQKVRSFLSNHKWNQTDTRDKDKSYHDRNHRNSGNKRRHDRNEDRKSNRDGKKQKRLTLTELVDGACMDCGNKDHPRGDPKCTQPSFATKKLRQASDNQSNSSDGEDKTPQSTGFFRPGSKRT